MPYLCPACKSELRWGGRAKYQTTCEHVTHPNHEPPYRSFYYCANERCGANAPEDSIKRRVLIEKAAQTDPDSIATFWDEDGELYGNTFNVKFIDNNYGPFGSEARRMNVEIYKKDENKTILKFLGLKIRVEYRYRSDTEGRILRKKPKFIVWRKSGLGYTYVSHPLSRFRFYNHRFKNNIKSFRKNGNAYSASHLNVLFRPRNINVSSVIFSTYLKIFYPRVNKMLKDEKYKGDY